jgi:hypothetical protein
MKKKISTKKSGPVSTPKKRRPTQPRLIHRERSDLQLKDYLMEDHPELSLPCEVGAVPKG